MLGCAKGARAPLEATRRSSLGLTVGPCALPLVHSLLDRQEPYIVTACDHCFCMKHASDDSFKKSSCPGCGAHLPSKRGMNQAKYRVETEDLRNLNGFKPDVVLALAGTAIQFWWVHPRAMGASRFRAVRHTHLTMCTNPNAPTQGFAGAYSKRVPEARVHRCTREHGYAEGKVYASLQ
jgi:hypothetical protein